VQHGPIGVGGLWDLKSSPEQISRSEYPTRQQFGPLADFTATKPVAIADPPLNVFIHSVLQELRRFSMSDLVPNVPGRVDRKRQRKPVEPIVFNAPTAAADPQSELENQVAAIESSKKLLGFNVATAMNAASQRGFMAGLTKGLQEGAVTEAKFFSNCIATAGTTLL
jgi:hypothetical protein